MQRLYKVLFFLPVCYASRAAFHLFFISCKIRKGHLMFASEMQSHDTSMVRGLAFLKSSLIARIGVRHSCAADDVVDQREAAFGMLTCLFYI